MVGKYRNTICLKDFQLERLTISELRPRGNKDFETFEGRRYVQVASNVGVDGGADCDCAFSYAFCEWQ